MKEALRAEMDRILEEMKPEYVPITFIAEEVRKRTEYPHTHNALMESLRKIAKKEHYPSFKKNVPGKTAKLENHYQWIPKAERILKGIEEAEKKEDSERVGLSPNFNTAKVLNDAFENKDTPNGNNTASFAYPMPETRRVWVCSDGTEFSDEVVACRHELGLRPLKK